MISDSPVLRALQLELSRHFGNNKLEGGFYIEDGPDFSYPEAHVRHKGRVWKIDLGNIRTDKDFAEEIQSIMDWLKPIKPNPGAAAHWKNQPVVDRTCRIPTWTSPSSSIPSGGTCSEFSSG